jgi:hypothetical protein
MLIKNFQGNRDPTYDLLDLNKFQFTILFFIQHFFVTE